MWPRLFLLFFTSAWGEKLGRLGIRLVQTENGPVSLVRWDEETDLFSISVLKRERERGERAGGREGGEKEMRQQERERGREVEKGRRESKSARAVGTEGRGETARGRKK